MAIEGRRDSAKRRIGPYLQLALDQGASDIYFTAEAPVMLRVEGAVASVPASDDLILDAETIAYLVESITTEEQWLLLRERGDLDFALTYGDIGRFRINVFHQRGGLAMVLRNIPAVPSLLDLNMPPALAKLAMRKRGLILMVGATGCGKSTTLAAMIRHRNENSGGHILTIEDPVEFIHGHGQAILSQRELGMDTRSYSRALKSALREAPDVILIGECRDRETMESCIQLAGTGHLAISTLHANNAYQALMRITSLFPQNTREQLYLDLSLNLLAIISQRLVMGQDNKRVAAVEVMLVTPYIAELIRTGRVSEVWEAMHESEAEGMQTFDDALLDLHTQGRVSREQALANADSADNLRNRMDFGG